MIVNGERSLAYVVTIDEIKPIEGYDRVEYARTSGWWVVISKAYNLKVGDKCVYFEIDSKVPETDKRFEFLAPKKYRIKTQKMCKVYSQGLLVPVSEFPEIGEDPAVGTDVTKQLGVMYYVAEDNTRKSTPNQMDFVKRDHKRFFNNPVIKKLMRFRWFREFVLFLFHGKKKAKKYGFPSFVSKTDEDRCLIGDTKVITSDGILRIADIVNKQIDTKVLSFNEETKNLEWKEIIGYQKYEKDDDLISIGYPYKPGVSRLNHLVCTPDHKVYTNRGYISASNISVGDTIYYPLEFSNDAI